MQMPRLPYVASGCSRTLTTPCGDRGGGEIGELAPEQRQEGQRAAGLGVPASRLERPAHLVAVPGAEEGRVDDERRRVHPDGAGGEARVRAHLVRDQAGRLVAVTPLLRAWRTSVSS